MRALRGMVALTSFAAIVSSSSLVARPASAFVSPGYHSSRARRTLVGHWRIVGNRKDGMPEDVDPNVRIAITTSTMRRSKSGVVDPNIGRYDVLHEDDTSLELRVTFEGSTLDVDVLIESSDALSFYIRTEHDDDDSERALRLERVDE